jgi:hypothetical protein
MRQTWTRLTDAQLLAQCEVDTYRASGPGGQKRNKTSSAVRLRHPASKLIVIAEESRSQHENRARALRRLREALYLKLRDAPAPEQLAAAALESHADITAAKNAAGRLAVGRRDARFWPAAGVVLDVLAALKGRVGETAAALGVSTGNLIDFLQMVPKVWEQANHLRSQFGQKPLRGS